VSETRFRIAIQDNGPASCAAGAEDLREPAVRLEVSPPEQSRGSKGIGISAAGMFGLLTTGKPIAITSARADHDAHYFES